MAVAALGFAAAGTVAFVETRPSRLPLLALLRIALSGESEKITSLIGRSDDHVMGLATDLWLILGYLLAVVTAGFLGRRVLVTRAGRWVAEAAITAGVLGGALAMGANGTLNEALSGRIQGHAIGVAQTVQALTLVALVLIAFALPVALMVFVTVVSRLALYYVVPGRPVIPDQDVFYYQPPGVPNAQTDGEVHWRRNWALPDDRTRGGVGICLSGGGIRSATFSLGALQVLQEKGVLGQARYLVGVSGGGYAAGAVQLALCRGADVTPAATPTDVFANGSVEFDHLRRHGRYLADGAGQWLIALTVLLRGVVVAQVTLLLAMVLAGLAIGEIYAQMPPVQDMLANPLLPDAGIGWAMGAPFLAALGCWLLSVVFENSTMLSAVSRWLARLGTGLFYLGLVLVAVGIVIPLLTHVSQEVADTVPDRTDQTAATATAATTVLSVGYLATVAAIFTAARRIATSVAQWLGKNRARLAVIPGRILQRAVVLVGVLVLVLANLFVFARVVAATTQAEANDAELPENLRDWRLAGIVAVLAILTILADQTRWSLHPFYKRRLMSAFAVRRVRGPDNAVHAEPYDFDREMTYLHAYCARHDDFPQVIFVTAANVSGQDLAPPGRRAVPYSLSGDWIGSPRLGWVKTERLSRLVSDSIRADLTVQGAMALSGAAFASAMGAASSAYSLLFALTNARLGSWMPNPAYLCRQRQSQPGRLRWLEPRLPRWRRVSFLIREIFGRYSSDGQMLLVTDGGHYDNLGLIELLRHAPAEAYCFDASGGANLAASALGPAITLAWQELGIRIEPRGPAREPDAADGGSGPAAVSSDWADAELRRKGVLVCDIHYPPLVPGGPREPGVLYFGRAVITVDAPWSVQAYGRRVPPFPNDSTSDQWFGQEQFDAYHALGRHIGERVLAAARSA